jgi:hypothetical protein
MIKCNLDHGHGLEDVLQNYAFKRAGFIVVFRSWNVFTLGLGMSLDSNLFLATPGYDFDSWL